MRAPAWRCVSTRSGKMRREPGGRAARPKTSTTRAALRLAHVGHRGARLQRFARSHGFRWVGTIERVPPSWCDLACFFVTTSTRGENAVEGERRGRRFTLVDWHYDVPPLVDGQMIRLPIPEDSATLDTAA